MFTKRVAVVLSIVGAAGLGFWTGRTTTVSAASNHVFEIRTYTAAPGKLDALHARFRDDTMRIFDKHGMHSVAYFKPQDDPLSQNTLIYILSFPSRDAAKKSWDAFRADPEWQKVQKESEAQGKLVEHVQSIFADPLPFSPMK
jgi:NIPSNAP